MSLVQNPKAAFAFQIGTGQPGLPSKESGTGAVIAILGVDTAIAKDNHI